MWILKRIYYYEVEGQIVESYNLNEIYKYIGKDFIIVIQLYSMDY